MVDEPASGRVFRAERRVRLSDADPDARLRFDACARYLHDVSNDDTQDAKLSDNGSWVVRRTELEVLQPPRMMERVSLATWCGGTGSRWAERRVSVLGVKGGRIEATSLWVYVDLKSMMPKRLGPDFLRLYGPAAAGRIVPSKLVLGGPTPDADRRPWPLRRTDLDVLAHVNNAAYWAVVEEIVGERPELVAGPHRAVVEFARPIDAGASVDLLVEHGDADVRLWLEVGGVNHASAHLAPTPTPTPT